MVFCVCGLQFFFLTQQVRALWTNSTEAGLTQGNVFLAWQFRIVADLIQKRFESMGPSCTAKSMICLHIGVCVLGSSQNMCFLAQE
jgi:hypothetical protein